MDITKVYNTFTSNTEEIYQLRNHNKILVTKIKKLKSTKKADNLNEDIEGKLLEKQEENQFLLNINQELEKEIKKLKEDKSHKMKGSRRFRIKTIYSRKK